MESLTENRSLLYSLAGAGGFVVMLALGWLPEFSDQFSIVDFSDEFRSILLQDTPKHNHTTHKVKGAGLGGDEDLPVHPHKASGPGQHGL